MAKPKGRYRSRIFRKGDTDTDRTSSKRRYRSRIFRKGDTDTDRTSSWPELLRGETEREIQIGDTDNELA